MKLLRCLLAANRKLGQRGLSLVELMSAIAVFLMSISAVIVVYIMGQTIGTQGSAHIDLQTRASLTMEKIARGNNGQGGLREARSANNPNANQIDYTDVDLNSKSFYVNGTDLMYDPDINNAGDEEILVSGLRANPLGFQVTQVSTDQYRIALALERQVGTDMLTSELETSVTIRN